MTQTIVHCQAVLLDMDGTILDSSIPVRRQWRLWAERVGIPFELVEAVMHGRRAIETMRIVAPHLPQPATVEAFLAEEAKDMADIFEIPGALRFLETLPANRWAIVTSATHDVARARMTAAGLPPAAVLVSADRVTNGKPHPEAFLTAAAELGVAPEHCLVVEDSPAGIEAAKRGGMQTLGITTHYAAADLGAQACVSNFAGSFQAGVTDEGVIRLAF